MVMRYELKIYSRQHHNINRVQYLVFLLVFVINNDILDTRDKGVLLLYFKKFLYVLPGWREHIHFIIGQQTWIQESAKKAKYYSAI